jgi:hypothetical protein
LVSKQTRPLRRSRIASRLAFGGRVWLGLVESDRTRGARGSFPGSFAALGPFYPWDTGHLASARCTGLEPIDPALERRKLFGSEWQKVALAWCSILMV